jgi:hypothetical protein
MVLYGQFGVLKAGRKELSPTRKQELDNEIDVLFSVFMPRFSCLSGRRDILREG